MRKGRTLIIERRARTEPVSRSRLRSPSRGSRYRWPHSARGECFPGVPVVRDVYPWTRRQCGTRSAEEPEPNTAERPFRLVQINGRGTALCCSVCIKINSRHNGVFHAIFSKGLRRQSSFSTIAKTAIENRPEHSTLVQDFRQSFATGKYFRQVAIDFRMSVAIVDSPP